MCKCAQYSVESEGWAGKGLCQFQAEGGHGRLWGALEKIRECYLEKVTLGFGHSKCVCTCVHVCGVLWQREQPGKGGEGAACTELVNRGAAQPQPQPHPWSLSRPYWVCPVIPSGATAVAALPDPAWGPLWPGPASAIWLRVSLVSPSSLLSFPFSCLCLCCSLCLQRPSTHHWGQSPVPGRLSWPLQSWSPLP